MTGAIILAITLAAFVAAAIWMLTLGRKVKLPDAQWKFQSTIGNRTLHIYRDDSFPTNEEIKYTRLAIQAMETAWFDVMGEKSKRVFTKIGVYYTDNFGEHMNGFQAWASPMVGRKGAFPILYIRPQFAPTEKGDPLIRHELMHALAARADIGVGGDNYHSDPRLWRKVGTKENPDSVEARAIEIYKRLVEEANKQA